MLLVSFSLINTHVEKSEMEINEDEFFFSYGLVEIFKNEKTVKEK